MVYGTNLKGMMCGHRAKAILNEPLNRSVAPYSVIILSSCVDVFLKLVMPRLVARLT
jgi:hypothetical protein